MNQKTGLDFPISCPKMRKVAIAIQRYNPADQAVGNEEVGLGDRDHPFA